MNLIKDTIDFYKGSYLMIIMNITYNYTNCFLYLIYLCWYIYYITINSNINYYLILYSFVKINSFFKINSFVKNIIIDIIFSIIYIGVFIFDLENNNNIHTIQYLILYNLLINVFIFIYGTLYLVIKYDFYNYNMIDFTA